jgi:hypothetical protein
MRLLFAGSMIYLFHYIKLDVTRIARVYLLNQDIPKIGRVPVFRRHLFFKWVINILICKRLNIV